MKVKIYTVAISRYACDEEENKKKLAGFQKNIKNFIKNRSAKIEWLQSSAGEGGRSFTQLTAVISYAPHSKGEK